MNRTLLLAVAMLILGAAAALIVSKTLNSGHAAALAAERATWAEEKAELESALAGAGSSRRAVAMPAAGPPTSAPAPAGPEKASPLIPVRPVT